MKLMGVVNVTPDSFSDGGLFAEPAAAIEHGRLLVAQGAEILDVGGESTRPGAEEVSAAEELRRVEPVIAALAADGGAVVSVDTSKAAVAAAALDAGASIVNDVTALRGDPEMAALCAERGATVVLMHMLGTPGTMQDEPRYEDVVGEIRGFFEERLAAAEAAGIDRERVWLDPGIGFGKTPAHNLALLNALPRLASHGLRLLVGASRKRTVLHLDPTATDPLDRLGGSLAFALHAARHGAAAVRVHDVRETRQALLVQAALAGAASA